MIQERKKKDSEGQSRANCGQNNQQKSHTQNLHASGREKQILVLNPIRNEQTSRKHVNKITFSQGFETYTLTWDEIST